jgi:hypothetical protein
LSAVVIILNNAPERAWIRFITDSSGARDRATVIRNKVSLEPFLGLLITSLTLVLGVLLGIGRSSMASNTHEVSSQWNVTDLGRSLETTTLAEIRLLRQEGARDPIGPYALWVSSGEVERAGI